MSLIGSNKPTKICGFDCDGVITVGIRPGDNDVIITGRSYEEMPETFNYFKKNGVNIGGGSVYFNPIPFNEKTRETSGIHKANIILRLMENGIHVINFFEDDPIQAAVIERMCPMTNVIMVVHNLTEKENIRHLED